MKRIQLVVFALVVLNLALFANMSTPTETPTTPEPTEEQTPVPVPVDSNGCAFGGRGSTTCNIGPGILLSNGSTTIGCSVSCIEGYFACCGERCICIPVNGEEASPAE